MKRFRLALVALFAVGLCAAASVPAEAGLFDGIRARRSGGCSTGSSGCNVSGQSGCNIAPVLAAVPVTPQAAATDNAAIQKLIDSVSGKTSAVKHVSKEAVCEAGSCEVPNKLAANRVTIGNAAALAFCRTEQRVQPVSPQRALVDCFVSR